SEALAPDRLAGPLRGAADDEEPRVLVLPDRVLVRLFARGIRSSDRGAALLLLRVELLSEFVRRAPSLEASGRQHVEKAERPRGGADIRAGDLLRVNVREREEAAQHVRDGARMRTLALVAVARERCGGRRGASAQ